MIEIEKYLLRVKKPQRYIDRELNLEKKDWNTARVRLCLAFPDVYEIGMSYFGFQILYSLVNEQEEFLAERSYAPWTDLEAIMRKERIPLFSWESRMPIKEFDIVGFTLPHEMNYTNVLNMLDLAGLEVESRNRTDALPLIIAGGECALSGEPMSPFIDAFILGDGEDVILEIMETVARLKRVSGVTKNALLEEIQHIEGVYVPSFYEFTYNEDGTIASFRAHEDAPKIAHKKKIFTRRIVSLKNAFPVIRPLIPLMRIVQERSVVEVRRGCTTGCRFCRAGMINRPVRERSIEQIRDIAEQNLASTGYGELSLLSLNTVDYSRVGELIDELQMRFEPEGVSLSLPSLKVSGFGLDMAERLAGLRKSGLTFAPETGSERLSRVINKPWDREKFLEVIREVIERGWRTIKLYFMIGLPTETYEDLNGIIDICRHIDKIGRAKQGRKFRLNVTISPFVPKPHTPFQWEGQMSLEELAKRVSYIRKQLRGRSISLKEGDVKQSYVEGVLSRGDRRLADAVKEAWRRGAVFDNWSECFRLETWLEALERTGLEPAWYAQRTRPEDEIFPWDHLSSGVIRTFLKKERIRAANEKLTSDCAVDGICTGCGVCPPGEIQIELAHVQPIEKKQKELPAQKVIISNEGVSNRYRLFYYKKERIRFLSHLDLAELLVVLFKRAGLPMAYTKGFNPQPRVQFCPPLPLGFEGEAEIVDIMLREPMDDTCIMDSLNSVAPKGLRFQKCVDVAVRSPSIESLVISAEYIIDFEKGSVSFRNPSEGIRGLLDFSLEETGNRLQTRLMVSLRQHEYQNPLKILGILSDRNIEAQDTVYMVRTKIVLGNEEA